MNRIAYVALVAIALSLTACSTVPTITTNPVSTAASKIAPAGGLIATGLQNAASNLDKAVAIQVLPPNDPADSCVHSVLQLAGLEAPLGGVPPQSFVPTVSDIISAGSVAYILAAQLAANPRITVPDSCKAVVGGIVIDGLMGGAAATVITAH